MEIVPSLVDVSNVWCVNEYGEKWIDNSNNKCIYIYI